VEIVWRPCGDRVETVWRSQVQTLYAGTSVKLALTVLLRVVAHQCSNPARSDRRERRPQTDRAASLDPERQRADSLHPGGVPRPCQSGRETTAISGHSRATRTHANLGTYSLTPCAKRPSKQTVSYAQLASRALPSPSFS
jgi:hypothetical protein